MIILHLVSFLQKMEKFKISIIKKKIKNLLHQNVKSVDVNSHTKEQVKGCVNIVLTNASRNIIGKIEN